MYEILRNILVVSVLLVAYFVALFIYLVPYAWLLPVVMGIAIVCNKTYRYTAYGTARWAEPEDLEDMIDE